MHTRTKAVVLMAVALGATTACSTGLAGPGSPPDDVAELTGRWRFETTFVAENPLQPAPVLDCRIEQAQLDLSNPRFNETGGFLGGRWLFTTSLHSGRVRCSGAASIDLPIESMLRDLEASMSSYWSLEFRLLTQAGIVAYACRITVAQGGTATRHTGNSYAGLSPTQSPQATAGNSASGSCEVAR